MDRVQIDKNTMILETVGSYSICYVFKGQSYSAKEKLQNFANAINTHPEVKKVIEKAVQSIQNINLLNL